MQSTQVSSGHFSDFSCEFRARYLGGWGWNPAGFFPSESRSLNIGWQRPTIDKGCNEQASKFRGFFLSSSSNVFFSSSYSVYTKEQRTVSAACFLISACEALLFSDLPARDLFSPIFLFFFLFFMQVARRTIYLAQMTAHPTVFRAYFLNSEFSLVCFQIGVRQLQIIIDARGGELFPPILAMFQICLSDLAIRRKRRFFLSFSLASAAFCFLYKDATRYPSSDN